MIIYLNETLAVADMRGWFRKVGRSSNRPLWDTFLRKRAQRSARDLKWDYFLAWVLFKYLWVKKHYLRGKNILLDKSQKLYKKPLSSSEFQTGLSPWDIVRQGQTRDHQWATKEGYHTDKANSWWQKDETRERSPTVNDGFENMAVLRRNYTNVYGHWKYFFCPFFLAMIMNWIL